MNWQRTSLRSSLFPFSLHCDDHVNHANFDGFPDWILQITGWQNSILNEHCYTTAEACRVDRRANDIQLADPRRNLMVKFSDGNTIIIYIAFIVTVVSVVIVVIINSFVITSVIDVVSFVNVHRYRHH